MRLLICGGRDFTDRAVFDVGMRIFKHRHLGLTPIELIIHGAARGADTLAEEWAFAHSVSTQRFPADWKNFGPSAGPLRNAKMLEEGKPDFGIAFPGGKGTADMCRRMLEAGVPVMRFGTADDVREAQRVVEEAEATEGRVA